MNQEISEHIEKLMYTHECIMLPGLGGLVAQYEPLKYDGVKKKFILGKKYFVLNSNLKHDDGLLTESLAKLKKISFAEANVITEEFCKKIKTSLSNGDKYVLSSLGSFYKDENDVIRYNHGNKNFSTEYFGLSDYFISELAPVEMSSPITEESSIKVIPMTLEKSEEEIIPIERNSSSAKWWVAAAIIPLGFYLAWIPMKTNLFNEKDFHYSELNPFSFEKPKNSYTYSRKLDFSIDTIEQVNLKAIESLKVKENLPAAETTAVETKLPLDNDFTDVSAPSYHIIGGCFSDESNAKALINELNTAGYDAFILDKNKGLYRVSVVSNYSKKSAKIDLAEFKNKTSISGWILKK